MPTQQLDGALLAQILLEQGKQSTQLAVMDTKLSAITDHESRIRSLERFRYALVGAATVGGALSGLAGYLIGHVR
jgi:hypothetical protein